MSNAEKIHVAKDESGDGKIAKAFCGKRFWSSELVSLSGAGLLLRKPEMCGMCRKAILKKLKLEMKGERS